MGQQGFEYFISSYSLDEELILNMIESGSKVICACSQLQASSGDVEGLTLPEVSVGHEPLPCLKSWRVAWRRPLPFST